MQTPYLDHQSHGHRVVAVPLHSLLHSGQFTDVHPYSLPLPSQFESVHPGREVDSTMNGAQLDTLYCLENLYFVQSLSFEEVT